MSAPIIASYGHGTENDFLILFNPDESIEILPHQVAAMCSRSSGIGADGFIRIARREDRWFMDYHNADGTIAEMCGNGIRVMAKYLITHGHQPEGIFAIDTRDGMKHLRVPLEGDISVNMGKVTDEMEEIETTNNSRTWSGYNISVGNPHAVVFVDSLDDVGSLENAPLVTPTSSYPEGVNVEFVEILKSGEAKMRVHERGSGETRSCGTGTCAVALAAILKSNGSLPARWTIYPPGGRLIVDIDGHSNATLIGPAVIVSEHDITKYLTQ
ncbi:MAG: diaminopimelate epimerase [Candidatus Planktophila sp.]|jgi:diaminopimelate epimerase|tara:strand:- start:5063 stop:5872 length:810 start_codon:yes stop_codon:yes gene_type:complete